MSTGLYKSYMDLTTQPGSDLDFNLQITPMSLTATAYMVIDGMVGSPFNVGTSNGDVGVNPYLYLSQSIPGAVTQFWPPGVYDYRVFVLLSDGSIDLAAWGCILLENVAMGYPRAPTNSLQYVAPATANTALLGGQSQFFNTYALTSVLALTAPSPAVDGTIFQTGDAGGYVDTNGATLTDVNGSQFANPIDGSLQTVLTWGPGTGGSINPNLPTYSIYTWQRTTVTGPSGSVTYWKNIT